ncbi:MAG TPA: YdeI/OmpD-associated family protein, partial [Phycisphaerales bacterium]|nr:YdeI/OmpD-associated family protein [Phycisphaerales bacterium]
MKRRAAKASPRRTIRFEAVLVRPRASRGDKAPTWSFLRLPQTASNRLPSRGMVSIRGDFNGVTFQATLSPDGQGGHWLEVNQDLRTKAGAKIGQVVAVEMAPLESGEEPEPEVPPDFQKALEASPPRARQAWSDITPLARRDWIQWITSGKRAQTRVSRIEKARDMLASGKRRPCCFDRSGMYDKSLGCPVADDRSSSKRSAGQIGHSLARPTPGNRRMTIHDDILAYNAAQAPEDRRLCDALSRTIDDNLPGAENKIWHGHPVWFLDGNPIAGYSKLKNNVRLLFWSGQS